MELFKRELEGTRVGKDGIQEEWEKMEEKVKRTVKKVKRKLCERRRKKEDGGVKNAEKEGGK